MWSGSFIVGIWGLFFKPSWKGRRWYGGAAGSAAVSRLQGSWFNLKLGSLFPLCVHFLWVVWFPPIFQNNRWMDGRTGYRLSGKYNLGLLSGLLGLYWPIPLPWSQWRFHIYTSWFFFFLGITSFFQPCTSGLQYPSIVSVILSNLCSPVMWSGSSFQDCFLSFHVFFMFSCFPTR